MSEPGVEHRPRRLDLRTVALGAVVDLAIFFPLVVGVAVLKHNDIATQESYLWVASAVALFVAPAVGGAVAGRRRPDAPLTHAGAAAAAAFVAFLVFRIVDGAISGRAPHAAQMLLFLTITVAMGIVGGYLGFRPTHATDQPQEGTDL